MERASRSVGMGSFRISRAVVAAAAGAIAITASTSQAQVFWDGGGPDDNWLTAENWNSLGSNTLPGFADTAVLNNGDTIIIDQDGPVAGAFAIGRVADTTINPFNLGLGGTVNFNGGSLVTGSNIPTVDIGVGPLVEGAAAVWNHNNGTVTTGELFRIGVLGGSKGTLNMNNGLIDVSTGDTAGLDFMVVGDNGEGIINMTGGEIRTRVQFFVALQNTAKGTVNISGGLIDAFQNIEVGARGNQTLGTGSVGVINQTGGTVNARGLLVLGWDRFASGSLTSSAGAVVAREILIGRAGNGTLNLSGTATMDSNSSMVIATFAEGGPSNGVATISGNAALTTGGLFVAEQGNGTLNLQGGSVRILGVPRNGANFPGSDPRFGNLVVGQDGGGPIRVGEGLVNHTGGSMTVDTNVFLGDFDDSNGVYRISGGTLNVLGNFNVGGALASNAPADDVRTGTQGQAQGAKGTLAVVGAGSTISIGGDLRANPADRTRTDTPNQARISFDLDNTGVTQVSVTGQADLDGAVIDLGFTPTSELLPTFNQVFNLITAQVFGATGTGTTQNTGTGRAFTVAAGDELDWVLQIVAGGNGEILQAVNKVRPGDTDRDTDVDFNDLLKLAQNYGATTGASRATGDFNRSGSVNFADLLILAQNYGIPALALPPTVSPQFASDWALAQSLVPEPVSLGALATLAPLALGRRRRNVSAR